MKISLLNIHFRNTSNKIGWLLSFFLPVIAYFTLPLYGTASEVVIFLSIMLSAIMMWIFRLVPEYLPGLLVVISCAILKVVPANIVLSGFFSETFLMVFSILAMTILIARSNLIPRYLFKLLRLFTKNPNYFDAVFFTSFALLTPLIPSIVSRTHLVGEKSIAILDMFGVREHEGCVIGTLVSSFFGATLFSTIFLSASLMNFVVLALLSPQEQLQFYFVGWLNGALGALIVMLLAYAIFYAVLQRIFFKDRKLVIAKNNQLVKINSQKLAEEQKKIVEEKIADLGPISKDEWFSMAALAVFFTGMIILPYYKISPAWIAIAISFVLLAFGILTRKDIKFKINWKFLLYMASIIGISGAIHYLNISGSILEKLQVFTKIFEGSPGHLFTFFVVVTLVVRLLLPIGATIALLVPVFITLSILCGVTAWTACFTCLMISDIWFFKYQCIFYTPMTDVLAEADVSFNERKFLTFNAMANIIRILSIIASFYYWHWIGL